jgi:hypothetical protein
LHGSLRELNKYCLFFRATPKRRKAFVLHALHGSLHELNNYCLFFRATPKRREIFVLHALHGSLHELNNVFLSFRATRKRCKVFVLHALHGSLHELNNDFLFFEQHLSVARYLFYMRCMVHYINFVKDFFRATPKHRKVFVLHALHGTLHKFIKIFEQHLSVARYLFYMRCMARYIN